VLPYRDSRITRGALLLFFVLIIAYAYFEARGILYGPVIHVSSEVTEVHDPFIQIQGQADRIAKLSMNGRPISVTEEGKFSEAYLLAPGLNRIYLDAVDRYGRKSQDVVQIVYTPTATSAPMRTASTTTATTSADIPHLPQ
jgi:hypothetical protein